jgi:hypothetical protein
MNNDAGALKKQGGPMDRAAAADYIAELSAELANLARHHGLDALGYILDNGAARGGERPPRQRAEVRSSAHPVLDHAEEGLQASAGLQQRNHPAAVPLQPAGDLEF